MAGGALQRRSKSGRGVGNPVNIWLDDIRDPAKFDDSGSEWIWVKSVEGVKVLLEFGSVEKLSLDNDLGEGQEEGRRLVLWMAEFEIWPKGPITIHSANPVAREYMTGMLRRYAPDTITVP